MNDTDYNACHTYAACTHPIDIMHILHFSMLVKGIWFHIMILTFAFQ